MQNQVTLSLISGLIGSVIGAILGSIVGAIATFFITRYSIKESYKKASAIEKEKYERDKQDQVQTAKNVLHAEVQENKERIERGGKYKFTVEGWNLYKAVIFSFPNTLQERLLKTYAEIGYHNNLIEYDFHTPFGLGSMDSQIIQSAQRIKLLLEELLVVLETHQKN